MDRFIKKLQRIGNLNSTLLPWGKEKNMQYGINRVLGKNESVALLVKKNQLGLEFHILPCLTYILSLGWIVKESYGQIFSNRRLLLSVILPFEYGYHIYKFLLKVLLI